MTVVLTRHEEAARTFIATHAGLPDCPELADLAALLAATEAAGMEGAAKMCREEAEEYVNHAGFKAVAERCAAAIEAAAKEER